jgi:DNA/RNA-binding domain of Phe-tRNA-synthetase-like protein
METSTRTRTIRVDADVWELAPKTAVGLVVARGIDNRRHAAGCAAVLAAAVAAVAAGPWPDEVAAHPAVAPWRAMYAAFGAKPSKFRSGIEALLRSARSGRLASVNPLVDLYNAVSLRHGLPVGGEDLALVRGDLVLGRAVGGEDFLPLGGDGPAPPAPGEVIWRDDAGAVCRCWNWREAARTALSSDTRDAVLVVEALGPDAAARARAAADDLAAGITERLGGACAVHLLAPGTDAAAIDA